MKTTQKHLIHIQPFAAISTARENGGKVIRPAPKNARWVKTISPPPRDTGGPLGDGGGPLGDWGGPLGLDFARRSIFGTKRVALGYHPDLPDRRDCPAAAVEQFMEAGRAKQHPMFSARAGAPPPIPTRVHLEDHCDEFVVEDQGQIGSCTANAVIGVVEHLLRKYTGHHLDLSRMFLYKNTRRLLGWTGDTGAYVRTTIKALRIFGVPPESDWPYESDLLDTEPDGFNFAYGQNYKSLKYARVDEYGLRGPQTLDRVKKMLADGFPLAFGFPVYRSIENLENFVIPFPTPTDVLVGGHAIMAVGYDDAVICKGQTGPGALIMRNSWGVEWGDHGYGFLPYRYVTDELAADFWALHDESWLDPAAFEVRSSTAARVGT